MDPANYPAVTVLNQLITLCKDRERYFRLAAWDVTSPELKRLFESYARQRALFAAELQAAVRKLGGAPSRTGSVGAILNRLWTMFTSVFRRRKQGAVIAECEQVAARAVSSYEEALKAGLPAEVQSVITRHYTQIKESHERIIALVRAGTSS
jgi:uncharacterized protein (TIGR02284 family)